MSKIMLGWVRTILPSRFQFEFEEEAPFGVPGTSIRSVPTLTGEGINTYIHICKYFDRVNDELGEKFTLYKTAITNPYLTTQWSPSSYHVDCQPVLLLASQVLIHALSLLPTPQTQSAQEGSQFHHKNPKLLWPFNVVKHVLIKEALCS